MLLCYQANRICFRRCSIFIAIFGKGAQGSFDICPSLLIGVRRRLKISRCGMCFRARRCFYDAIVNGRICEMDSTRRSLLDFLRFGLLVGSSFGTSISREASCAMCCCCFVSSGAHYQKWMEMRTAICKSDVQPGVARIHNVTGPNVERATSAFTLTCDRGDSSGKCSRKFICFLKFRHIHSRDAGCSILCFVRSMN